MPVCVPAAQEPGTTREPQQPQQDSDRESIRAAQAEGLVQRRVECGAFFDHLDGMRLECDSAFHALDAPAAWRPIWIAESLDSRVGQYGWQHESLEAGNVEESLPLANTGAKTQSACSAARLDAIDPGPIRIRHRGTIRQGRT